MTDQHFQRFAPFELRATNDADGLTLEGYAAVFDSPAAINSWEGRFTETIARGAFTKTIAERTPVLQFDHGTHPLIGSIPLGQIRSLSEDDHGLFVSARLSDNWLIEPIRDAIRDGAVDGMSFQFQVPKGKDSWNDERTERTIHEVILHELGPVVFPAYADTAVGVRSDADNNLLELIEARMAARLPDPSRTPDPVEERQGTEPDDTDNGAAQPQEPQPHSGMSPNARERALTLLQLSRK